MGKTKSNFISGFTLTEILVAILILSLLAGFIFSTFISFRKNQSMSLDTETVLETIRQARSQTLSSKGGELYGVHFSSSKITLFTGNAYNQNGAGNISFDMNPNNIISWNLSGGGNDVVFSRLNGETTNDGTITISSQGNSPKTITIYKTGLIESN